MENEFVSPSPINTKKLTGQNGRLYNFLATGQKIHCMSGERMALRIGYLNSRISDLVNKHHIPIKKEWISVLDLDGNPTTVIQYSLSNAA